MTKYALLGLIGLILIFSQNCAPVKLTAAGGATSEKAAALDLDPVAADTVGGSLSGEIAQVDSDVSASEEMEEGDIVAEASGEKQICIGNGIKVPLNAVLQCANGDKKCVRVCFNGESSVASFHSARDLFKGGGVAGDCR